MSRDVTTHVAVVDDKRKRSSGASPLAISVVVLVCVLGGALLGLLVHSLVPSGYLDSDSKEVVRLGMGLVGTTVSLALGLLIGSGKGFFDTQSSELTQLAADIVLLDKILKHYGPETRETRDLLRSSVAQMVDVTWGQNSSDETRFSLSAANEVFLVRIPELCPENDSQRLLQSQALRAAMKLAHTRSLMMAQKTSIPMPLLTLLVLWLTLLFMSFGLFVRPNPVVVGSLFASALALCGAIFLVLELYQPYSGFLQASSVPLRKALTQLGQ